MQLTNIHLPNDWFSLSTHCKTSDILEWEILLSYDNISQQTTQSQWYYPIQTLPRHSSLHFTNEADVLDELVDDHHQRDDKKGNDNE